MQRRNWLGARTCIWPVALGLLAGATTADIAAAQPITGSARWCVVVGLHGGTLDCSYHTLQQCMASASGVSNQCSLNPWYVERSNPRAKPRNPWR